MTCNQVVPVPSVRPSSLSGSTIVGLKKLSLLVLIQLIVITPALAARITTPLAPLSLAAYSVSSNSVSLVWQDGSTNETGFKIERALSAGGKFTQIAAIGANNTNYLNTGLKPSTVYYYRVRSYNSRGNSKYSNIANATTAALCSYTVAPPDATFDAAGGTGSFSVTVSTGVCSWTASSIAPWITLVSGNGGTGNGSINYFVAANSSTNSRTGTVNVAGKTFSVSQAGVPVCNYSLDATSASFSFASDAGSVQVTADSNCSWTAVANDSWLTVAGGAAGTGNGSVSYSVAQNTNTIARAGTLTIAGHAFTVNQAAAPATISLGEAVDNLSLEWVSGGDVPWFGENTLAFSGGDAAQSGAISDGQASWVRTTITGPATLSFYWKVSSEEGYDTLQFFIDDVQQFSISGEVDWQQRTVSLEAGTHSIGWVYSKDFCCAAGSDQAWIDQVEVSTGTCTYTLSSTNVSVGAQGGNGSVGVTVAGASGCQWTASTTDTWISLIAGLGGTADGSVSYSVAANSGTDPQIRVRDPCRSGRHGFSGGRCLQLCINPLVV